MQELHVKSLLPVRLDKYLMEQFPALGLGRLNKAPAGVMGVYISINTLCDMGATCVNVIGDLAACVVLKEKIKLDE